MKSETLEKLKNFLRRVFVIHPTKVLDTIDSTTIKAENTFNGYVEPVRRSVLKRFPVLFSLLVTIGVAATVLGIEKMILKYQFLDNSPEIILLLGISILVLTGTLYKKLG